MVAPSAPDGTAEWRVPLRTALLAWYDGAARDLPWRRTKDPYAVWVSEVMLQQTRVDTVVPYYRRFMERFPTPRALAQASEEDVLALWSGLGYYRRARLLHRGVKEVVARYNARVPRDPKARRGLPGVGRYTAGAIGSIAFGRPEAIVDGNVARVLARVEGIEAPSKTELDRSLWSSAGSWAVGPRPGDLNQALMELGATLCVRTRPRCERCPLRRACVAHREQREEELPRPIPRKPPAPRLLLALVLADDLDHRWPAAPRQIWLERREEGLFAGLWNLPLVEGHRIQRAETALAGLGLEGWVRPTRSRFVHVLSHRRLEVRLVRGASIGARPDRRRKLFALGDLSRVGTSRLTWRALESLRLVQNDAGSSFPARRGRRQRPA